MPRRNLSVYNSWLKFAYGCRLDLDTCAGSASRRRRVHKFAIWTMVGCCFFFSNQLWRGKTLPDRQHLRARVGRRCALGDMTQHSDINCGPIVSIDAVARLMPLCCGSTVCKSIALCALKCRPRHIGYIIFAQMLYHIWRQIAADRWNLTEPT